MPSSEDTKAEPSQSVVAPELDENRVLGSSSSEVKPGCSKASGPADVDPSPAKQEPSISANCGIGASNSSASSSSETLNRGPFQMPSMQNWPFNAAVFGSGLDFGPLGPPPMLPVLIPAQITGYPLLPGHDQASQQGGIFAVPMLPLFGPMGGISPGNFIPMSFNMPIAAPIPMDGPATSPAARQMEERQQPNAEIRVVAEGLRHRHLAPVRAAGPGARGEPPRQVVRRFRVGFQLDLLLLLKLAVVVFVFNQDGSKDRLMLLLFLAGVVYMYQTGALAPFLRWIQLSAQRAMMPPQPPAGVPDAPQVPGGGVGPPAAGRDAVAGANGAPIRDDAAIGAPVQDGAAAQGQGPLGRLGVDNRRPEQAPQGNWWGFFKEVQMLVVGFLTSLLPGFQNGD